MIGTDLGEDFDDNFVFPAGMVLVLEPVVWEDGTGGYRGRGDRGRHRRRLRDAHRLPLRALWRLRMTTRSASRTRSSTRRVTTNTGARAGGSDSPSGARHQRLRLLLPRRAHRDFGRWPRIVGPERRAGLRLPVLRLALAPAADRPAGIPDFPVAQFASPECSSPCARIDCRTRNWGWSSISSGRH